MTWEGGFVTKDESYAAVPYGKQFIILYKGEQITVCKTLDKAKEYIAKYHQKPAKVKNTTSKAKLPKS